MFPSFYNLSEICATAALKMQHWQQKTFHGYMGTIANALYFLADEVGAIVKNSEGMYEVNPDRLPYFINATELQAAVEAIGKQNVLMGWRPDASFGTARGQSILCFKWLEDLGVWGDRDSVKGGRKGNTPTQHSGINVVALLRIYETAEQMYVEVGQRISDRCEAEGVEDEGWTFDDLPKHKGNVVRMLFNAVFNRAEYGYREFNRVEDEQCCHEETPVEESAFQTWQERIGDRISQAWSWLQLAGNALYEAALLKGRAQWMKEKFTWHRRRKLVKVRKPVPTNEWNTIKDVEPATKRWTMVWRLRVAW